MFLFAKRFKGGRLIPGAPNIARLAGLSPLLTDVLMQQL